MPDRVLITGATGFSGRYLAERLSRDGATVVGLGRTGPTRSDKHVAEFHICDLMDNAEVERTIDTLRPDAVYHLAALISGTPDELRAANVESLRNLSGALRRTAERDARSIRMLVVGSAAELGTAGTAQLPAHEDAACRPESDYGRTKLEATSLALAEPVESPLKIIVARTFNLVGPGLGTTLSLGRFALQIAAVCRADLTEIECGNSTARRDFVDVRDAVDAYVRLLHDGTPGQLYNVCSGRSHSVRDLLHRMIERTGELIPIVERRDANRVGDLPDVYGDPTKTMACCGWRAQTPIEQSLADLLDSAMSEPALRERSAA